MKVQPTLVLPPRYSEDSIALWRAGLREGWQVERLLGWRVPDGFRERHAEIVLFGEPLFAAAVGDQLGITLLEPPFSWLAAIPQPYTRRAIEFTTFAGAQSISGPRFVKPADDKVFAARVYDTASALPGHVPDETPVLVSEPVEWEAEFRAFVLDGEAVTISPYLRNGELARDEEGAWPFLSGERDDAMGFLASVLGDDQVSVPPAVVVDVGLIKGSGWAVVEANAAWGSGIYGCDTGAVLRVVRRACVTGLVPAADRPWVVQREEYRTDGSP